LLLVSVLILGFVRSRPRSAPHGDDPPRILKAAIWIGLIGFAVQMTLNVAMLASTVPFWVLLGAISTPHARRWSVPKAAGAAIVGVCSLALVLATLGAGALVAADVAYVSSRLAYHGDAPGNPLALAEQAATLNPLSVKYSRAVAQSRSALVQDAILTPGTPQDTVRALYSDAKTAYDRTLVLSPNDYVTYSWLAGLQAATGSFLGDPALLAAASASARKAATLNLTHASVAPLLKSVDSTEAISAALQVPGLP
jgi:hypothetical protein